MPIESDTHRFALKAKEIFPHHGWLADNGGTSYFLPIVVSLIPPATDEVYRRKKEVG